MIVCATLYRRPAKTRQMLDALARCYGIADCKLLLSCDFDAAHAAACDHVAEIAGAFDACETRVFHHAPRLGIDINKLFVLEEAFRQSDYTVLLEDDCIPSPDALRFFEHAGKRFKPDSRVVTVSGYNRENVPAHNIEPYDLRFSSRRFVPWGWATWKGRYKSLFANHAARYLAETGDGANGAFDRWMTANLKPGEGMVYPRLSRILLDGFEDAEHPHDRAYFEQHEYNGRCFAGDLDLPDPDPSLWQGA